MVRNSSLISSGGSRSWMRSNTASTASGSEPSRSARSASTFLYSEQNALTLFESPPPPHAAISSAPAAAPAIKDRRMAASWSSEPTHLGHVLRHFGRNLGETLHAVRWRVAKLASGRVVGEQAVHVHELRPVALQLRRRCDRRDLVGQSRVVRLGLVGVGVRGLALGQLRAERLAAHAGECDLRLGVDRSVAGRQPRVLGGRAGLSGLTRLPPGGAFGRGGIADLALLPGLGSRGGIGRLAAPTTAA